MRYGLKGFSPKGRSAAEPCKARAGGNAIVKIVILQSFQSYAHLKSAHLHIQTHHTISRFGIKTMFS